MKYGVGKVPLKWMQRKAGTVLQKEVITTFGNHAEISKIQTASKVQTGAQTQQGKAKSRCGRGCTDQIHEYVNLFMGQTAHDYSTSLVSIFTMAAFALILFHFGRYHRTPFDQENHE